MNKTDHIQIQPYSLNEKDACREALQSNIPDSFSIEEIPQFENWLNELEKQLLNNDISYDNHYYTIAVNNKVVGCGGFGYDIDKNEVILAWGFIDKKFHKQGLGIKLFEYRLQQIKILYPNASVILDTTQFSQNFFRKFGFVTERFTKDGYVPGYDRYDMRMVIEQKT